MKKLLLGILLLIPIQGFASQAEAETPSQLRRNSTPLHLLALRGDAVLMEGALTSLSCPVDQRDSAGLTALFQAIICGHTEVADVLMRHGAQPTQLTTEDSVTPLHALMSPGANPDLVQKVLEWHNRNGYSFLDINARDKDGDTPLHSAIRFDQPQAALALLEYGPNIYVINQDKNTALFYACKKNYVHVALKIASLWDRNKKKTTPLHIATWANNVAIIKKLIKRQPDLEARNKEGTPLFSALLHGHCQAAEALIQHGARTDNLKNSAGANPLHISIMKGDIEDVTKLLNWLAIQNEPAIDLTERYHGLSPRQLAERLLSGEKKQRIIQLLENFGQRQELQSATPPEHPPADARPSQQEESTTRLHFAAMIGDVSLMQAFLSTHPQAINTKNELGKTPLFEALCHGNIECAQFLIEHGACTENVVCFQQCSPLHILALNARDARVISRVLDWQNRHNYHILDINAKTDNNYTPLMFVINRPENEGREEIVDELLRRNADIYCKDAQGFDALRYALGEGYTEITLKIARRWNRNSIGQTALHIAASAGNPTLLNRIIAELRPDLDARDSHGDSPLFEALRRGHTEVADALLQHGAQKDNLINNHGISPLHAAIGIPNNVENLKKLLTWQQQRNDRILAVNKKDALGHSPLRMVRDLLAGEDRQQVIDLLISLGAGEISLDDSSAESSSIHRMPLKLLRLLIGIHEAQQARQQSNGQPETTQAGEEILDETLQELTEEMQSPDDILDSTLLE